MSYPVLITGCSSGIGLAAARHLRQKGVPVIATARRQESVDALEAEGFTAWLLDVDDPAACDAVVARVETEFGGLQALVNNAGYGLMLPLEEVSDAGLEAQFATNVFSPVRLSRLFLPMMRAQGFGRIVMVDSVASYVAVPGMGPYNASKHAARCLWETLDDEIRQFGLRAPRVEPGVIRTEFGTRTEQERKAANTNGDSGPYHRLHDAWRRLRIRKGGADVKVVAKAIAHACTANRPRRRYLPGGHWAYFGVQMPLGARSLVLRRVFGC